MPVTQRVNGKVIETGEYKFDASGAVRALELLGKHLKLFTEKHEHTGEGGENLLAGLLEAVNGSTRKLSANKRKIRE